MTQGDRIKRGRWFELRRVRWGIIGNRGVKSSPHERWGDVSARACWEDHLRETAALEKFLRQTGARREAD